MLIAISIWVHGFLTTRTYIIKSHSKTPTHITCHSLFGYHVLASRATFPPMRHQHLVTWLKSLSLIEPAESFLISDWLDDGVSVDVSADRFESRGVTLTPDWWKSLEF